MNQEKHIPFDRPILKRESKRSTNLTGKVLIYQIKLRLIAPHLLTPEYYIHGHSPNFITERWERVKDKYNTYFCNTKGREWDRPTAEIMANLILGEKYKCYYIGGIDPLDSPKNRLFVFEVRQT